MLDDIDYCETCQHCELEPHLEPCVSCKTKYIGTPTKYLAKPQTNADRIRAMSDEEFAKWLLDVMSHKVACFGEGAFPYTPCRNTEHDCVKCGVSWLKQPAEGE